MGDSVGVASPCGWCAVVDCVGVHTSEELSSGGKEGVRQYSALVLSETRRDKTVVY